MIPNELLLRSEIDHPHMWRGIRTFASWIPRNSIVAEIGTFLGESSRALLDTGHLKLLFCIDPWADYEEVVWRINDHSMAEIEKLFDEHMVGHNNYVKVKQRSTDAVKMFPDQLFDVVYVDASHVYEQVKEDILAYLPKVKSGGWMAGHDYNLPGVEKACMEIFGGKPWSMFEDHSWVYVK